MIRIGIAGCGHIGTVHSFALAQLRKAGVVDAAVVATHDTEPARAEALARHHDGARAHPDLASLAADVDVVWVCTWTAAHLEAVRVAVEAGRAVFCEKPLAPTMAECHELAALLRRVPHQVGLVLRHAPVFATLAEAVADRRFGTLLAIVFRDDQYFPIQGIYGSTWRKDVAVAGGGTLLEHSIHDVDVLRWIAGEDPAWVSATIASRAGHPGIEDVAAVLLHFPSSAATLTSVWHQVTSRPSTRRVEVFFEDAVCWTDDDHLGPLHICRTDGQEELLAPLPAWVERFTLPEVLAKPLALYAQAAKVFLDALAADGHAARGRPDVEVALVAHAVVDAAYRSAAAGGTPVPVGALEHP